MTAMVTTTEMVETQVPSTTVREQATTFMVPTTEMVETQVPRTTNVPMVFPDGLETRYMSYSGR